MRRLSYTDAALDDLVAIALYIADQSASRMVAEQFAAALRGQCSRLAALLGTLGTARPELRPDIRSTPFRGYVVFFRYEEGLVEIVNILAGRRDIDGYYGNE